MIEAWHFVAAEAAALDADSAAWNAAWAAARDMWNQLVVEVFK